MTELLKRPPVASAPADGLLLVEHFQMAYVTTDLDRACAMFGERMGIRNFAELGGETPAGGGIRARFAWVGTIMYELIEAWGPGSALYTGRLPADGFAMRHHHLGFLAADRAQWDAAIARAEAAGLAVPFRNANPHVDVCFVDVPELGHYLEYLLATPAGLDFFDSVPRS